MSGHKLKLIREVREDEKLAPQQKVIYARLLNVGVGKEVDREQFVKDLESSGELTTKQSVDRVVSYYMQAFAKDGIAEVIKPEPAPKAEKEPKAKKSEGASKSPADSAETKPAKKSDQVAA